MKSRSVGLTFVRRNKGKERETDSKNKIEERET